MTDKEMAEEYAKSVIVFNRDFHSEKFFELEQAYLAGLKAGKDMNVSAKWHKVADGATEATKELQKENEILEGCLLAEQEYSLTLEKQIEEMKSDVKSNIKWADQNKNDQMWQKLVKMYNQWEQKHK